LDTGAAELLLRYRQPASHVVAADPGAGRVKAVAYRYGAGLFGPLRRGRRQGRAVGDDQRQAGQAFKVGRVVQSGAVEQAAVPHPVQVAAPATQVDLHRVAALVVAVAGMQWLVDIADEMDNELE